MTEKKWMLYGCTGYSGKLIAKECKRQGLSPILAGRSAAKVKALAEQYGFEYRVFDLGNADRLEKNIADCYLVFNTAGPFTSTCLPLLNACLKQKVHNLSLVGEVPLLEEMYSYDQQAKDAGITLAVGLGYDVIPTDCIANVLKERLPDATHLTIGMQGSNDMSPGSTKELIEQVGEQPFWARRNGKLIESKAEVSRHDFGNGEHLSMAIAWGDTSSAYHSTGIPNIDVFAAASRMDVILMSVITAMRPIIKIKAVQNWLNKMIDRFVAGPSEDVLENTPVDLFGEAKNAEGETVRVQIRTASGYKLTYLGAVYAIQQQLANTPKTGYQTPAQLLGSRAIEAIEGSSKMVISESLINHKEAKKIAA